MELAAASKLSGRLQRRSPRTKCDLSKKCDLLLIPAALLLLAAQLGAAVLLNSSSILIERPFGPAAPAPAPTPGHWQPSWAYGARNRSVNFTHLALDELSGSVYVGATNWLFQVSAANLRPEVVLKSGPNSENSRDCAPADCLSQLSRVEPATLPMQHSQGPEGSAGARRFGPADGAAHLSGARHAGRLLPAVGGQPQPQQQPHQQSQQQQPQQQQQHHNNYNKILALDTESRQLIVCGSLNQGACRRHQLGQLANYSELIPLPVASNDEHSSSVALVSAPAGSARHLRPALYVAATNSRLGPYREMVPAISARYLEPAGRAMQIIERSFTDSARVDISFELRDYYLVNYVHAFQHQEFVYFATVQRRSPLRQLEEWGYVSRLARLCLSDLSFQSYAELTLECRSPAPSATRSGQQQQQQQSVNYNLLQDAHLTTAGSQLAAQLGVRSHSAVLIGSFAQSRDHTTRSQPRSAICLFPMDKIELKFSENIQSCLNGTNRARNMNYIAGSVGDCPKLGKAANVANSCSEPIKLNGSLPMIATPVITYDDELITAIHATQAPSSPVNLNAGQPDGQRQLSAASLRQHQVLLAGTGGGRLKKIALVPGDLGFGVRGLEFDSLQVDESGEPILADLLLTPAQNPQLGPAPASADQFALVATANRLAKVRVNGCKAARNASASPELECNACARLQDPFCGWCASSGSCSARDECLADSPAGSAVHWSPFDQIRCADYQPVWPRYVPLQAIQLQAPVDVNIAIDRSQLRASAQTSQQLTQQLAQAQFTCHYDYLVHANRSRYTSDYPRVSGATTKASQARLNLHTSTVVVGCPLPTGSQRPGQLMEPASQDFHRTRLSVRLVPNHLSRASELSVQQLLGLGRQQQAGAEPASEELERELGFYDCSAHSSCGACLAAGSGLVAGSRRWSCSWCALSNRCTFNASHADFGCAASAISGSAGAVGGSTTPSNQVRASHLTASLDVAQASVFSISIDRPSQCPADESATKATKLSAQSSQPASPQPSEILVPHNSRRSIHVPLRQPLARRPQKLECLVEVEGAKARLSGRLAGDQQSVVCQESLFTYQEEIATLRGQLTVLANEQPVERQAGELILYKCHLFGVNPPALTSTVGAGQQQHSSAAWRAHELLQLVPAGAPLGAKTAGRQVAAGSDCSLCLNVERKYQCVWCGSQCLVSDQCGELAASTCPPPRIDSIHPTSGPLEGGTLLTIEGSNLGSNEREIQDKITVAGEPCQLVMYSVSTRIVCKTAASLHGAQSATVFVGNRAGVTSAHEKFHYKAVHLHDVNPKMGPASGGTRLQLTGANLNVGSRVQVFLDELPCALDSQSDVSSNQITCVTAPNLLAGSPRISKLTLMLDNSTHQLPMPFTYQPDPIITSIEPAESFVSGGRLILIAGHHLASPQSTKLMVYHEHKRNIVNGTSCVTQDDTLITCLTPALSREMLAELLSPADAGDSPEASQLVSSSLSYESGGLRLKMMLFMDDVRSVRNLDEYYHHLPHHLTYYEDPQLFRLPSQFVDYSAELVIQGQNLRIRHLEKDMLVAIGPHVCPVKSVQANQVTCRPPHKIAPVHDDAGRLVDKPLLPIVALIGSHLMFQIGHMQYQSSQYQAEHQSAASAHNSLLPSSMIQPIAQADQADGSSSVAILVLLSVAGFVMGLGATLVFALARFRRLKAEREYKRIQLQMGSLDINGQPIGGGLFDKVHHHLNSQQQAGVGARALEYVGGALAGKKLFYQLNQPSFPPSPLTDISSLTGVSNQLVHNRHVVKLASNGNIINSAQYHHQHQQQHQQPIYNSANSSSTQSSPSSVRNSSHLFSNNPNNNSLMQHNPPLHQQLHQTADGNKSAGVPSSGAHQETSNGSSRNFNWTQEAPSTIVPYAVIEACNLSFEAKNAI